MKALLIIDVQNDFMPTGNLPVPGGDEIVPIINAIQSQFDLVVATQDWHPANHGSFASQHAGKHPFDKVILNGLEQTLWPDHCIEGTEGANLHPNLAVERVEAIIRKGTDPTIDSYSAFYDNGHRKTTGLLGYLRDRNIDTVYLCGLAGDICVFYSAQDAIRAGLKTYLLKDATRAISETEFALVAQKLSALGGEMVDSGQIKAS